jgi:signal transduction histidine kinase
MKNARSRAPVRAGARRGPFETDFHRMSHELRTPLNHINGFAELLLMDASLSPVHANYVRAILSGSDALQNAVTSYLDRLEATPGQPCSLVA